jgi:SpoVK/Ycf46/Vps4 family AAA+-type ATPase
VPIRGVLLCGVPGAGKTLLARAASLKFQYNFLSIAASDLVRGDVGQSEKRVAALFQLAKTCKPCVLFFDECHALFGTGLGPSGRKVLSQFLLEMDQVSRELCGIDPVFVRYYWGYRNVLCCDPIVQIHVLFCGL